MYKYYARDFFKMHFLLFLFIESCFEQNTDIEGESLNADPSHTYYGEGNGRQNSSSECQKLCQNTPRCVAFVWKPNRYCWLKPELKTRINQDGTISGKRDCVKGKPLLLIVKVESYIGRFIFKCCNFTIEM